MASVGNWESLSVPSNLEADSESEQFEEREFGFWLYLMSDAIIFALLFATYSVMLPNTASGPAASSFFDLRVTALETFILLCSSATFGFAVLAARAKQKTIVLSWLLLTLLLGGGFITLEVMEFSAMIDAGAGPDVSGSLSAFFTLVGTHGLHVSTGLIGIVVMMGQVLVKGLNPAVSSRLLRLGLFWHFLDIVWIGVFSIIYLPGAL